MRVMFLGLIFCWMVTPLNLGHGSNSFYSHFLLALMAFGEKTRIQNNCKLKVNMANG